MGKAFEKQIKAIEDQGKKQVDALNTLKPNNHLAIEDVNKDALNNDEAKKELDEIKAIEKNIDRERLIYKTIEYTYSFKTFQAIKLLVETFIRVKLRLNKVLNIKKIY